AFIVRRPTLNGDALGFALFVDADGALGMRVEPRESPATPTLFKSGPGAITTGEWVHVAGVSCGGHMSMGADVLYVNGREVWRGPASRAAGAQADRRPAPLHVGGSPDGGGLIGWIDEVRIHSRVARLWAPDPMPWRERIAREGLPAMNRMLAPGRGPRASLRFDDGVRIEANEATLAQDPAVLERFAVDFKGDPAPGVSGSGVNGRLTVDSPILGDWNAGSLEVWVRPRGVNNVSSRNVSIFSLDGLSVYFYNSVTALKPIAFYYRDAEKKLHMHRDGGKTEFHPGRWYHLVLTWDAQSMTLSIDGQSRATGENRLAGKGGATAIRRFSAGAAFDLDELHFYAHRLSEAEVLNRYHAVVDPAKLVPPEKPAPIDLNAWRLPSANTLHYQMKPSPGHEAIASAELVLVDAARQSVFRAKGVVDGNRHALSLPALKPGRYALRAIVEDENSALESSPIIIEAEHFAWEGNALGETEEVFPPFKPVQADESGVISVVQRTYRMNGFGLWDSVQSQSRELLARPVELRYRTVAGREGVWKTEAPALETNTPQRAVFRARAVSDAVVAETRSEVEVDGMMKVTLRLSPGAKPESIAALWLDIPLKESEARLMHEDTGSLRANYSGSIPSGTGTVWKSDRDTRWPWRNAFAGYVWIGGEDRGVAWFAENDKGWVTEKGLSDKPLQEIVRADGEVAIRVNLVNIPVTLTESRELVFGMQASPAKPVPDDWRTGPRGGGLPVTPWGGHQCADRFPYEDRWEVVDQIIHFQTNRTDRETAAAWFAEYRDAHDVPPVRGVTDWVKDCVHFSSRSDRPVLVYFEEMAAPTYRRDWHVYKDEWSRSLLPPRQTWPDGYDLFRQGTPASAAFRVNFIDSYRDYGLHYANEWLKRGVGIYWDNTVLTTSLNPLTSEAYLTEDGSVQPALTLWNQREYSRRMWTLTRQWERKRGERLIFLQHMTNAHLLPILAWADTAFDNEWSPDRFARVFPERQK
ncbi:MAG: LamG domain-containing protein, partial [Lentisphaerae bacterium]|nr:LamG domain-containing protein [Lentisphaerota bacterium]